MCLFTWCIFVFLNREYFPLLFLVFTASLMKETGLVCALLVLFGPWSWAKRVPGFIGLIIAFIVCRKFLMTASGATVILLPLNEANSIHGIVSNTFTQIKSNISETFSFHLNSPFVANCGMLFVMFLLPCNKVVKLAAGVFMAGQIIAGTVTEFRDFFEILPLGIMQLSNYLYQDSNTIEKL